VPPQAFALPAFAERRLGAEALAYTEAAGGARWQERFLGLPEPAGCARRRAPSRQQGC
jgi:hypothetical protein